MAKLSTLQDPFTGPGINTTLWNASTIAACTLDPVNQLVQVAVATTSGTYNSLGSMPWDATGSSVFAEITAAPNGNGGTVTNFKLAADPNNSIGAQVTSGGAFSLRLQTAGAWTITALPSYNPDAHRWWKLSEANGSFTFSTSSDGRAWTAQATVAHAFPVTGMQFYFQAGTTDTEPAGMVATIRNINTVSAQPNNPNWPTMEHGWGASLGAQGGNVPLNNYVDVSNLTRSQVASSRGKQYELEQIRSGELRLQLDNQDGRFDPLNTAGPFYGHVHPYQPYRLRAQWPPTRNLLRQSQATGGDVGGYSLGTLDTSDSGPGIYSRTDSGGGAFVASTSAWAGGTVAQFAVPASTAGSTAVAYIQQPSFEPGATYSAQMQVRNVTASTTVPLYLALRFFSADGSTLLQMVQSAAITLTGATAAPWTRFTVTGTAPAGTAFCAVSLRTNASPSASCNVQVDAWQLERASAPSAWCAPGTWYPIYSGFTERWDSSWSLSGTYGQTQVTGVDSLSLLSQVTLSDPCSEEIKSYTPRFLYRLDDPQGATTFADSMGNYRPATLYISKDGPGSLTTGNSVTANDPVNGVFAGSGGTVMSINNPSPGQAGAFTGSALCLSDAGITGPANPALFSRIIAFRYTGPVPQNAAFIWVGTDGQMTNGQFVGSKVALVIDYTGRPFMLISGPTNDTQSCLLADQSGSVPNVCDGNWHLAIFGYNQQDQQLLASIDGGNAYLGNIPNDAAPTGIVFESVGGFANWVIGGPFQGNFQGDLAFIGEFTQWFGPDDCLNFYNAWKNAFAGESSDARYQRILQYAGYQGARSIDSGQTRSLSGAKFSGQDALSALEDVVATENGQHYINRTGAITFKSRAARYNATAPVFTFGENQVGGEWPYEEAGIELDATHISNGVRVTQQSSQQVFSAQDAASVAAYFPRTMTRTSYASSTLEIQDSANYLLSRYKQPAPRVTTLVLHPSAMPAMWPVCLSLELGMRVRVMRRPQGAPPIQVDCYIEKIDWSFNDQTDATVRLQCSPADLTPYAVFAAFHTTLASPVVAGATTVTIKAGQDSVNPARAQLAAGQQLVLGQGTANAETVTIAPGGVPATTSGWTTCVLTLTSAVTKAHSAGDVVCEPLPGGVSDPATWDKSSQFDSTAFAY
ncbi:hypothetical protein [Kitasatospora sp. NPDC085464]|uniref:hypothetical protein n=1 Tax=Kitasatospora sp. NPDC085464 TaxID=3364063 RepID=UPI0037C70894